MKKAWFFSLAVIFFLFQLNGGCSSPSQVGEKSVSEKSSGEKRGELSSEPTDGRVELSKEKGSSAETFIDEGAFVETTESVGGDSPEPKIEATGEPFGEGQKSEPKTEPSPEGVSDAGSEPTADSPREGRFEGGLEQSFESVPDILPDSVKEGYSEGIPKEKVPEVAGGDSTPERIPEAGGSGGPKSSAAAQIKSVRAGNIGIIDGAAVTYIKPTVGKESGGFFVQATKTGPALFIALNPKSLNPSLSVGDIISFKADKISTTKELIVAVTAISGLKVLSKGFDVTKLLQDVSTSNDLVSNLNGYESEFIGVSGTVQSGPLFAGTGFRAFQFDTSAIKGDKNLQLRLPEALALSLGLLKGCKFSVSKGIVWRYKNRVQISSFKKGEFSLSSCPAPKVLSAKALSPTSVEVEFSRPLDPKSVDVTGSQFTFSGGLQATAVKVSGKSAIITTSIQSGGKSYTVTVSATVKDDLGNGIDPNANTATFSGYQAPAKILINEVNTNITSGCDLIELRVISGGSTDGFVLYERNYYSKPIYKFPALNFKKNQFIVIHLNGNSSKCNSKGAKDELKDPKGYPNSQYPENYDTAFDVYSKDTGLTSTDNVLTLFDTKTGKIVDAVLLTGKTAGNAATTSESQAAVVAKAKEWTDPNGKIPSGGFVDDQFHKNAAGNMKNCSKDAKGRSIQRISDIDTNTKKDWSDKHNATWGALNPGQKSIP